MSWKYHKGWVDVQRNSYLKIYLKLCLKQKRNLLDVIVNQHFTWVSAYTYKLSNQWNEFYSVKE